MEKLESNYNMIDWWKKVVLKNYANFSGRARRSEYWYFTLATVLLIIPFYILTIVGFANDNETIGTSAAAIYVIGAFGLLVPGLGVTVRRLHDTNKSGWNYFLSFIPFIGGIILIVYLATEGSRGDNNYGSDPKNPNDPEFDFEQTS